MVRGAARPDHEDGTENPVGDKARAAGRRSMRWDGRMGTRFQPLREPAPHGDAGGAALLGGRDP